MYFQYVDESGCPGALVDTESDIQPVLSLVGVSFHEQHLRFLTDEFLDLKQQFFPNLSRSRHALDWVLYEIKGSDISRSIRLGTEKERQHSLLFLGCLLNLVKQYDGQIQGKVYIKPPGGAFDGIAAYTSACQMLCQVFEEYLDSKDDSGIVVLDSRTQAQNKRVSHSIFTEKFRSGGDKYPRILEMPFFGHSENHVGIQIADLVNSALVYPMASVRYCQTQVDHAHVDPAFNILWDSFEERLTSLFSLSDIETKRMHSGIKVVDVAGAGDNVLAFGDRG